MIYVFRISNQPFYKIGITKHKTPAKRLSNLQTASPYIITIYATSVCNDIMEVRLHSVLRDYYVRGEWFELPTQIANRLKRILQELDRLKSLSEDELAEYLLDDLTTLDKKFGEIVF